ncbi:lycopene cyclase family protein [Streptacidiphilus sp. N1-12]|uniref:Lycopene cyclase family protein n=2 Tax=Streptacidiphilus alkalitolerans TaxID=3342712 RepID=A0ABV6V3Y2_9ACTN
MSQALTGSRTAYDVDVAVIGAGAAGLSLVHALVREPEARHLRVVLVSPAPSAPGAAPERTWCWWEHPQGSLDAAVQHGWDRLAIYGRDGGRADFPLGGLRYKMLRSSAMDALVTEEIRSLPAYRRVDGSVVAVQDGAASAEVSLRTAGGAAALRARWVFDSRPRASLPPARTTLLQHFRGWFVRCSVPVFDPSAAVLMDFRVAQPARGTAFGYVLPLTPRNALVEYTQFSRTPLDRAQYEAALEHYTSTVLDLGSLRAGSFEIVGVEEGVIPMTDAHFPRRVGRRVFRIGTSGGATRPSTGYTFAAVQHQSRAVARALARGAVPVPPRSHRPRHLAMDAALLRALDTGRIDGADFFDRLFRRNPPERLLRFLDGRSGLRDELAVGLTSPVVPMALSCLELPFRRRTAVGE